MILEPVMMNIGLVVPQAGYLQALRDACDAEGAALIYDEVKCGGTIAYGGTTERYGVRPHLAAYAKAIGGGATIGAFGGEARFMEWVTKGAAQQGTFNGNPLSVAAGLAALTQVLTKDSYDHLGKLGTLLAAINAGVDAVDVASAAMSVSGRAAAPRCRTCAPPRRSSPPWVAATRRRSLICARARWFSISARAAASTASSQRAPSDRPER